MKKKSKKPVSYGKAVEKIDGIKGLDDSTGWLKLDGYQCYHIGDETLIPIKTLAEVKGQTVWYRRGMFSNLQSVAVA